MARMKAIVCLPTYNERENVERMVRRLHELDVQVLVIDDNSPDGTGAIADALAAELAGVAVLHRPHKEGLGPAYIAGFRRALAEGADLILEMDCDFSHDPADVPRLLSAAENADLVIASRYVKGGGTRNWNLLRRFISRGVRDMTAGFRCYRRAVLEALPLDEIHSKGYAFQIEMTYRTLRKGLRVHEIPITFVDRLEGGSKMSRAIVVEGVWKVPALRFAALRGRLR
jgi:dolichol-phosphate mannosyltransferase